MAKKKKKVRSQKEPDKPESKFPIIRTCLLFAMLVLGFHLVQWLFKPQYLAGIQLITSKAAAWLIGLSGIEVTLKQIHIHFAGTHWEIVPECTALSAIYVYVSFIVAYPSTIKAKVLALVAGIPTIFLANLLRLFTLAWVLKLIPGKDHYFHDYIWQIGFIFLLILMWMVWIELAVKREATPAVPG
jgi:exosortase/archaeosortase family protein